MRVEVFAHLDLTKDVIEIEDDLTEAEIEEAVYDYVSEFFDWYYEIVKEENE